LGVKQSWLSEFQQYTQIEMRILAMFDIYTARTKAIAQNAIAKLEAYRGFQFNRK
jgi:hypothetical protein